jgi:hypothetical protein
MHIPQAEGHCSNPQHPCTLWENVLGQNCHYEKRSGVLVSNPCPLPNLNSLESLFIAKRETFFTDQTLTQLKKPYTMRKVYESSSLHEKNCNVTSISCKMFAEGSLLTNSTILVVC